MAYQLSSRLGALLLALGGCGSLTDNPSDDPPATETPTDDPQPPQDPGPAFRFFTSDAGGAAQNMFATVDAAHVAADGSFDVAPGDYYFSVTYAVCAPGLVQDFYPRQSPIACRSFRIGANGQIVAGAAVSEAEGVACPHEITSTSVGLAIGLAPFEVAPKACGIFVAQMIPAGLPELSNNAVANLSFTAPMPVEVGPSCGDGHLDAGEQCDDGNAADHDGCSALCKAELDCDHTAQ